MRRCRVMLLMQWPSPPHRRCLHRWHDHLNRHSGHHYTTTTRPVHSRLMAVAQETASSRNSALDLTSITAATYLGGSGDDEVRDLILGQHTPLSRVIPIRQTSRTLLAAFRNYTAADLTFIITKIGLSLTGTDELHLHRRRW